MTLIIDKQIYNIEEIGSLGQSIAQHLGRQFILWLNGDCGAGKTTLTRSILYHLGLDPRNQVSSPTFTYLNEYKVGNKIYGHLDLYRSSGDFSILEVVDQEFTQYDGLFIEWAENIDHQQQQTICPTHSISISFTGADTSTRSIDFMQL